MFICELCGSMLRVDRDIDDERVIVAALHSHRIKDCPRDFPELYIVDYPRQMRHSGFANEAERSK